MINLPIKFDAWFHMWLMWSVFIFIDAFITGFLINKLKKLKISWENWERNPLARKILKISGLKGLLLFSTVYTVLTYFLCKTLFVTNADKVYPIVIGMYCLIFYSHMDSYRVIKKIGNYFKIFKDLGVKRI